MNLSMPCLPRKRLRNPIPASRDNKRDESRRQHAETVPGFHIKLIIFSGKSSKGAHFIFHYKGLIYSEPKAFWKMSLNAHERIIIRYAGRKQQRIRTGLLFPSFPRHIKKWKPEPTRALLARHCPTKHRTPVIHPSAALRKTYETEVHVHWFLDNPYFVRSFWDTWYPL